MKTNGINLHLNGALFLAIFAGALFLEFYFHVFEQSAGLYLKWQNHDRPQLGRMWERARQGVVAQHKIKSILSNQGLREQSTDALESIGQLFKSLTPSSSLVVSRKKFLSLYYDYPGQWARRIISPFDLIKIDARRNWDRVLLTRFGGWVSVSFIDRDNMPISEIHLALDKLTEIQSTRTIQKGRLEKIGMQPERIFSFEEFMGVLQTLDTASQKALFPDPQWFLEKNYHVTRIGFSDPSSSNEANQPMMFAIEYDTDYYPSVLLIPAPLEMANNFLSQMERGVQESAENETDT